MTLYKQGALYKQGQALGLMLVSLTVLVIVILQGFLARSSLEMT